MLIVGIDGGMIRCGISAVQLDSKGEITLVNRGVFTHSKGSEPYNEWLGLGIESIIYYFTLFLENILKEKPDIIFSETIPVGKLGSSDSQVVAAVTACRTIAFQREIPWRNVAANTVKKEITTDHRATKTMVRNVVLDLFPSLQIEHKQKKEEQKQAGLKQRVGLPQDLFDSIAIAVTGARIIMHEQAKKEKM